MKILGEIKYIISPISLFPHQCWSQQVAPKIGGLISCILATALPIPYACEPKPLQSASVKSCSAFLLGSAPSAQLHSIITARRTTLVPEVGKDLNHQCQRNFFLERGVSELSPHSPNEFLLQLTKIGHQLAEDRDP